MKKVRKSLAMDVIDCSESVAARKQQIKHMVKTSQKVQKPDRWCCLGSITEQI